ncbi:hypothetical protein SDRG_00950 [Saprolegnia diclina VS20]|uniref:U2A'/phosphoprotein 32 family A C-terminal domain-containing protein n=1 Tax=Saprolegnia diclina (strain VS20) TaxID=1156394 RepID=T0QV79_SAPDV|nr:hypothetical protein SDRG_00950 [Saprolegnia diclina VS20]EQC42109.1 hypothetical protein SDRG_00950 [Saprolegnia diclina VS20]|eukprot:XP_008604678.1 hypothetical protein SDRG_00950 [Saprolegnia diclina VS20]
MHRLVPEIALSRIQTRSSMSAPPTEKPKIKKLTKSKVDEVLGGKAVLDLTHRGVETMDAHACDGLSAKKLDLSHNKLTRFSFSMAMTLTQLKITSNLLTDSGVADLSYCKALVTLDLSDNKLSRLPGSSLRHCTQLKALVLTKNAITSLDWLPSMPQLTSLIVSQNRIGEISEKALGKVKNLVKISISHNKLKALPDMAALADLSELRISNNRLTALPATLANNRNLKILDACHNAIDTWDGLENLGSLKQLKQLNLKGNPLCGVAAEAATTEDEAEKKAADKKNKLYNFKMKRIFEALIIRDGHRVLEKRTHGYVAPPKPDPEERKKRKLEADEKAKSDKKAKKAKKAEKAEKTDETPVEAALEEPAKKAKKEKKAKRVDEADQPAKAKVAKEDLRPTEEKPVDDKSIRGKKKKERVKFIKESGALGVVQMKKSKATKAPIDMATLAASTDVGMGGDSAWD